MRKTNEKMQKNHGITLIALIITIVVMIILVAVTVTMAVNGGLFSKAQTAGTQTNEAVKKEQELGNGRIKIGDTWYDSPQDYVNNKPPENQGNGGNDEDDNCTKCSGLGQYMERYCTNCESTNTDIGIKYLFEVECPELCYYEKIISPDPEIDVECICSECGNSCSVNSYEMYYYSCFDCGNNTFTVKSAICEHTDCTTCGDLHYYTEERCPECDSGVCYIEAEDIEELNEPRCYLCKSPMDTVRFLCPVCGECNTCFDSGTVTSVYCFACKSTEGFYEVPFEWVWRCPSCEREIDGGASGPYEGDMCSCGEDYELSDYEADSYCINCDSPDYTSKGTTLVDCPDC